MFKTSEVRAIPLRLRQSFIGSPVRRSDRLCVDFPIPPKSVKIRAIRGSPQDLFPESQIKSFSAPAARESFRSSASARDSGPLVLVGNSEGEGREVRVRDSPVELYAAARLVIICWHEGDIGRTGNRHA